MTKNNKEPSIWQVIEFSIAQQAAKKTDSPSDLNKALDKQKSETTKKKLLKWTVLADTVSLVVWTYSFIKLLIYDIDQRIINAINPNLEWILWFKSVIALSILAIIGLLFWRGKTLLFLLYVIFFPLIVIFWKLPKIIYKKKSWMLVIAIINTVMVFFKNFRYNLITKSLIILCVIGILFSTSKFVLLPCSITVVVLMFSAIYRTIKQTFQENWFIQIQEKALSKFVDKPKTNTQDTVQEKDIIKEVKSGKIKLLDEAQLQAIATTISSTMLANRATYFWAYQLQKYKKRQLSLLFNITSYLWLFLGTGLGFWLINVALFKIDPNQFQTTITDTKLAFLLYSYSNMFFNDAIGITAIGNISVVARLVASLTGALFLATVGLNIVLTVTNSKDNSELTGLVSKLKKQARKTEENFIDTYSVKMEDAMRTMAAFNKGFLDLINLMVSAIPSDFMNPEHDNKSKE